MAIDDAGAGRVQGTDAGQRGLHLQGFFTAEALEIEHSVGTGARLDAFQAVQLGGRGGHQQLAATAVGHAALRAVGIEQFLAPHAQAGLERPCGVVQPRVNHFTITRTGAGADGVRSLQHHHLPTLQRQRASHCQANHARAHHYTIHRIDHQCVSVHHLQSAASGLLKTIEHVDGIGAQLGRRITALQHEHRGQTEPRQPLAQAREI